MIFFAQYLTIHQHYKSFKCYICVYVVRHLLIKTAHEFDSDIIIIYSKIYANTFVYT
jgi:hypothetical protein